jgi:hypothetical protein
MGILGRTLKQRDRALGRRDRARGARAEARVVAALRRATRPWWILDARRAHASEDRTGIDVVVETSDLGKLFLQVKSSECGAAKWRRRHRHDTRLIGVVVVRPTDNDPTIYGRALGVLILLRERAEARLTGRPDEREAHASGAPVMRRKGRANRGNRDLTRPREPKRRAPRRRR